MTEEKKSAAECFQKIIEIYNEYRAGVQSNRNIELMQQWLTEIVAYMAYIAAPMGESLEKAKTLKALYESKVRERQNEIINSGIKVSATNAEATSKGENAALRKEAGEWEGISENLKTMYGWAEHARFVISQHIKVLGSEKSQSFSENFKSELQQNGFKGVI